MPIYIHCTSFDLLVVVELHQDDDDDDGSWQCCIIMKEWMTVVGWIQNSAPCNDVQTPNDLCLYVRSSADDATDEEWNPHVFRVLLSPLLMITHSSSTMDYLFSRSAFVGATRKHPILGLNPRIIIADCPRCCGPCFLSAHLNEFFHFSVLRCLIISLSTRLCPFFVSPTIHSNGWWLQKKR